MMVRAIQISSLFFLLNVMNIDAQTVSAEIQSINQGILIPRMNTAQMEGIDTMVGDTDDGLLIYNIITGGYHFFDGYARTWNRITPGSRGTDGADGANGPQGPQGPIGMSRGGAAGPGSGDIVYQCWDYNHNQIMDMSEDINNDGLWNSEDCRKKGAQGPTGWQGFAGYQTISYAHTTIIGSNASFNWTVLPTNIGLLATSNVFVEGVNYNKETYVVYFGAEWYILTQDLSSIPDGTIFNIIIVN